MNINECYYLGYTAKVHGKSGEIIIVPDVTDPNEYQNLESMFVRLNKKDNALIPFFIENIQILNNGSFRVKIEDINSIEEAKQLVGKEVHMPLDTLPELTGTQFYFHEVTGFNVVDLTIGTVGKVKRVLDYPRQAILEVVNHEEKEILVPITDDIIKQVNRQEQQITIDAPEGLIDLYISE